MPLLSLLLIPLLGSLIVLACKAPRVAARVAMAIGVLELLAIGNVVWAIHSTGACASYQLKTPLLIPLECRFHDKLIDAVQICLKRQARPDQSRCKE